LIQMAIIRKKEAREMNPAMLEQKLEELSTELNSERGTVASGGKASNPGRIRELRRTIARLLTIDRESQNRPEGKPGKPKGKEAKPAAKELSKKKDGVMKSDA
jgi:large subunit ribosomal protein L29